MSDSVNQRPGSALRVWNQFAASILILGASLTATQACAVTAPEGQSSCRVTGAENLPKVAGGADAVCAAVERAVAAQAPNLRYSAEIRVLSRTALAAQLEVNGRKLPELRFSITDRDLNRLAIGRFANSVAAALARGAGA